MKYRKTARPLALLVASLLAFQPVTALAVTFADINQVPWPGAEVSINKAADLGLVVGERINGKDYFRPRDTVSLSESCQFAYKVLLQTKKASADASVTEKWKAVLNTYKIQDWAHPAVAFCLEEGILSISDLSGFVKNGSNMPASREQAAEILGRALTVGAPSYSATASNTKFNDNASISADARPYIALLNEAGIVNGDENKNFNPKKTLNRTETAVMVTNLYSKLNSTASVAPSVSTSTTSGTVKDLTNFYVNFEGSAAYYLYSSSGATATLNGDSSSVSELVALFKDGAEMTASLTLDGNNRITKLAVEADEAESEEDATEGELTNVKYDEEDDDGSITINGKTTHKIEDARDVDIEIDDEEYDLEELKDLFDECEDDDKVIEVKLSFNSKDELTKIKGTIEDAEEDDDDEDGYTKRGELTYFDYEEDEDEGEIELDDDDTYTLDDKTKIYIDGEKEDWEELLDLFEEAEEDNEELEAKVTLEDKDDDEAIKIEVFTEDYESDDEDELDEVVIEKVEYDEEENDDGEHDGSITVNGKRYKVDDVDDVEIEIVDGDNEIDEWEDMYGIYDDNKKMTVTIVLDDGDLVEIKGYVSYVTGRLVDFDDDSLTIEGKDTETEATYEFEDPDKISMKKVTGKTFEDLEAFIDWLKEQDDKEKLDLDSEQKFTLKFEVDEDGMIDSDIEGKYEKDK